LFELRGAWAAQTERVVVLTRGPRAVDAPQPQGVPGAPADRARVRGYVTHVAASGAFVLVWDGHGEAHVPVELIGAVHRPHFSAVEHGEAVSPPPSREVRAVISGQLALF
jgi:hypothetical protein